MRANESPPVVRRVPVEYKQTLLMMTPALLIGLVWLLIVLAAGSRPGEGMGWIAVPAVGALVAPVLLVVAWLHLRARVESLAVVDGAVVWTSWIGSRRVVSMPACARRYKVGFNFESIVVVAGGGGDRPLAIAEYGWDPLDDRVWTPLGLDVESGGEVSAAELRRAYPGTRLPWLVSHPVVAGVGGFVAVMLYIDVVVNGFSRL